MTDILYKQESPRWMLHGRAGIKATTKNTKYTKGRRAQEATSPDPTEGSTCLGGNRH